MVTSRSKAQFLKSTPVTLHSKRARVLTFETVSSKRVLAGFRINRAQEVRVRVVLARIRWRPAAVALELWNQVVMDVIFAQQRALADKSPIIARFLKRAMVEAFAAWHTLAAELVRHMRIIKRMRTRVVFAAAIAALQQWAVYMEDMQAERHEELQRGAHIALTKGDLRPLEQILVRQFKVPHVRRKYQAQSMREIVAEVLAHSGASHDTLALLGTSSLVENHDDEATRCQAPRRSAYSAAAAAPRDAGRSLALFKELEGRKHLQSAFAKSMRRSCEFNVHGGVEFVDPPPRPGTLKRDAMGDMQAARHAAEHRHDRQQILKSPLYTDFIYLIYQGLDFREILADCSCATRRSVLIQAPQLISLYGRASPWRRSRCRTRMRHSGCSACCPRTR